jgi:hypothetical protein
MVAQRALPDRSRFEFLCPLRGPARAHEKFAIAGVFRDVRKNFSYQALAIVPADARVRAAPYQEQ